MKLRGFIALDIGNVCIKIHERRAFDMLGDVGQDIIEKLAYSASLLETGRISEAEWLSSFRAITKTQIEDAKIIKAYNSILGEPIDGACEFVKEMNCRGFKSVFFSDTSKIHITYFLKHYDIAALVHNAVYSFEVGERKPHEKMFSTFETRFGKPVLYLDDKPSNIEAAKERGWNAILFNDDCYLSWSRLIPGEISGVTL